MLGLERRTSENRADALPTRLPITVAQSWLLSLLSDWQEEISTIVHRNKLLNKKHGRTSTHNNQSTDSLQQPEQVRYCAIITNGLWTPSLPAYPGGALRSKHGKQLREAAACGDHSRRPQRRGLARTIRHPLTARRSVWSNWGRLRPGLTKGAGGCGARAGECHEVRHDVVGVQVVEEEAVPPAPTHIPENPAGGARAPRWSA